MISYVTRCEYSRGHHRCAPARALADLGIRELAAATAITPRTLHRLETRGLIHVSEKKRHG
jgi:hypothetical protein